MQKRLRLDPTLNTLLQQHLVHRLLVGSVLVGVPWLVGTVLVVLARIGTNALGILSKGPVADLELVNKNLCLLLLTGLVGSEAVRGLAAVVLGKLVAVLKLVFKVQDVGGLGLGSNATVAVDRGGGLRGVSHLRLGLGVRLLVLGDLLFLEELLIVAN